MKNFIAVLSLVLIPSLSCADQIGIPPMWNPQEFPPVMDMIELPAAQCAQRSVQTYSSETIQPDGYAPEAAAREAMSVMVRRFNAAGFAVLSENVREGYFRDGYGRNAPSGRFSYWFEFVDLPRT